MTLRELIELARRHNLNFDARLVVKPLLKDKPRAVTDISVGDSGQIVFMCNRATKK